MQIETERLILRNFKETDIDDFYEYATQKSVGPAAGWSPYTNIEDAKKYLAKASLKPYQLAIVLKEENKVIGCIEIMDCNFDDFSDLEIEEGAKELGAVLNENYWSKGYMTEAAVAVIDYAFNELDVPSIYACCAEKNIGSIKLQEKCGMKFVKKSTKETRWVDGDMVLSELRTIKRG